MTNQLVGRCGLATALKGLIPEGTRGRLRTCAPSPTRSGASPSWTITPTEGWTPSSANAQLADDKAPPGLDIRQIRKSAQETRNMSLASSATPTGRPRLDRRKKL